jgi:hypothetical protein
MNTKEEKYVPPIWPPIHPNCCDHPKESYVDSWMSKHNWEAKGKAVDLYLWVEGDFLRSCIRYGKRGHEYISTGNISRYPSALPAVKRWLAAKYPDSDYETVIKSGVI